MKDITITDLDYYDHEEDEWIYDNNKIVTYGAETIIIKNGEMVKNDKIEVGKDITVLKIDDEANKICGVIIIKD
jgi:hypothetical protein